MSTIIEAFTTTTSTVAPTTTSGPTTTVGPTTTSVPTTTTTYHFISKDNIDRSEKYFDTDIDSLKEDDFFSIYHSANFKTGMLNVDQSISKVPNKDLRTYTAKLPFYSIDFHNINDKQDSEESEDYEEPDEDESRNKSLLLNSKFGKDKDVILQYDNSFLSNFF